MQHILDSIGLGGINDILIAFSVFLVLFFFLLLILWTILPFAVFGTKRLLKEIISEQREIKKCLRGVEKIERKIDLFITSESQYKPGEEGKKPLQHTGEEE